MNRRIKMIRAYFDLTSAGFADRLGATGVSREWFETGRGVMFPEE